MKRAAIVLTACALASCSTDDFGPVSYVDTLRVLAVRADRSWAEPGEIVHLDALVADPTGGGRPIAWAWSTCVNPGGAEVADCAAAAAPFATGAGPAFDVTVPANALDGRPAEAPLGSVGALFAACAGSIASRGSGAAPVGCADAAGRPIGRDGFMWGEKRIVVARGVRNANPAIDGVLFDGTPWGEGDVRTIEPCSEGAVSDCDDALRHRVEVVPAGGSAETVDGVTETLVAFFFVSSGGVADDFAGPGGGPLATELAAIHTPHGTPATAWLVLRDDRGGVTWAVRRYAVQ